MAGALLHLRPHVALSEVECVLTDLLILIQQGPLWFEGAVNMAQQSAQTRVLGGTAPPADPHEGACGVAFVLMPGLWWYACSCVQRCLGN
jgi:hypothetical protein